MTKYINFLNVDDLIGTWSSEVFFYDAFEDTLIEFHPDGVGCHVYLRPYNKNITLFRWTLINDRIEFVEYLSTFIEVDERTKKEEYSINKFEKKYSKRFFKGMGLNIVDEEINVIIFYTPLIQGINSQSFGLISKTINNSFREVVMNYEKVFDGNTKKLEGEKHE